MAKKRVEITDENLGYLLTDMRTSNGMTVFDAAYASDSSTTSIWKWEHDHTSPQVSALLRICKAYGAKVYLEFNERR